MVKCEHLAISRMFNVRIFLLFIRVNIAERAYAITIVGMTHMHIVMDNISVYLINAMIFNIS